MRTITELLVRAFESSKLDHCNALFYGPTSLHIQNAATWLKKESPYYTHSFKFSSAFSESLHNFKISFITTRHSTTSTIVQRQYAYTLRFTGLITLIIKTSFYSSYNLKKLLDMICSSLNTAECFATWHQTQFCIVHF